MKTKITVDISFFTFRADVEMIPQTREVIVEHFYLDVLDEYCSIILS